MKTKLSFIATLICVALVFSSFKTNNTLPGQALDPMNLQETAQMIDLRTGGDDNDNLYNYPDPFCGKTTIHYMIKETTHVNLYVVCPKGNVEQLFFGLQKPGVYSFTFDACKMPCGIYWTYLYTDKSKHVEKMTKNRNILQRDPVIED
jgi:hypothetical protein